MSAINPATPTQGDRKSFRSNSVKDQMKRFRAIQDFAQNQYDIIKEKELKEQEQLSDQKSSTPSNRSRLRIPYRHSASRPAQGVRNALQLTRDSHKPVISDSLIATLKNELQKGYCLKTNCSRQAFEQRLCKHHFAQRIKQQMQKMIIKTYRCPESAFNGLDFSGRGYILEEDLLNKHLLQRCQISYEDAKLSVGMFNMFNNKNIRVQDVPPNGMTFDTFKKQFFPHLCIVNEDNQSDGEKAAKKIKDDLITNQVNQPEIIEKRIKILEAMLKQKFANNYVSVREAFLHLDGDFDGFITVEDILRHFKPEDKIDYMDLKKLMEDKDSKHVGKIGYTDFSRWLGGAIHQVSGFYFRHDSCKNPEYEAAEKTIKTKYTKEEIALLVASNLGRSDEIEKKVMEKMKFQWKKIRKAFMNLNLDKSGAITKADLALYFQSWSFTQEQFDTLFNKFDQDRDGKISYYDFTKTIGSELFPQEGLFFRQDKERNARIQACKHAGCWQATASYAHYCTLHQKMHQDFTITLYTQMFHKIGRKWPQFIAQLKAVAQAEDQEQIFMTDFIKVCKQFDITLSDSERQNLLFSYPGRDEGNQIRINIYPIYDQKYNILQKKVYAKLDLHEPDKKDDAVDACGYTGEFHRPQKELNMLTEKDWINYICKNDKLKDIFFKIREIDRQRNGFVTQLEFDDIIKLVYPNLSVFDLSNILKPFFCRENKILVDYKKFRAHVSKQVVSMQNTGYLAQEEKQQNVKDSKLDILMERLRSRSKSAARSRSNSEMVSISGQSAILRSRTPITLADEIDAVKSYFSYTPTNKAKQQSYEPENQALIEGTINVKKFLISKGQENLRKHSVTETRNHQPNSLQASMGRIRPRMASNLGIFVNQGEVSQTEKQSPDKNKFVNDPFEAKQVPLSTREFRNMRFNSQPDNLTYAYELRDVVNDLAGQSVRQINAKDIINKHRSRQDIPENDSQVMRERSRSAVRGKSVSDLNPAIVQNTYGSQIQRPNTSQNILKKRSASVYMHESAQNPSRKLDEAGAAIGGSNLKERQLAKFRSAFDMNEKNLTPSRNQNNTSVTGTSLNSGRSTRSRREELRQIGKETIRAKLGYEWRNIYKQLAKFDMTNQGVVSKNIFEQACENAGVSLNKDDITKVAHYFQDGQQNIDYLRLSKDLKLHGDRLDFFSNQNKRANHQPKVKKVVSSQTMDSRMHQQAIQRFIKNSGSVKNDILTSALLYSKNGNSLRPVMTQDANPVESQDLFKKKRMTVDRIHHTLLNGPVLGLSSSTHEQRNEQIKAVLSKRKRDFVNVLEQIQNRNQNRGTLSPYMAVEDFKAALHQFGITISETDLSRFIVRPNVADMVQLAKDAVNKQKAKLNDEESTHVSPFDQTEIRIVDGYRKRVPKSARSTSSQAAVKTVMPTSVNIRMFLEVYC